MECLISEADVKEILGPYHRVLEQTVRSSYAVWEGIAPQFQKPLKRTRAQVVSNAYYDRALASLGSSDGVRAVQDNERLLLAFRDRVVMRFKRLDRVEKTRNFPTHASLAMDGQRQVQLDDIGHLPRIVLGYMLDGIPTSLVDVRVLFAVNNRVMWSYPIDGSSEGSLPLQFGKPPPADEGFEFKMIGEEEEGDEGVDGSKGG